MSPHFSRHVSNVFATVADARPDSVLGIDAHPDPIISSWRRCLSDYGLAPDLPPREQVTEAADVQRRREQLGELFDTAHAEMENLYEQTAGSGYAVLLTDAEGIVLDWIGDPARGREFADAGLWTGADWSESIAGTNGIGTCIAERRAVTVHRDEHFLCRHIDLSCSAAPIFDPAGDLLAILDASAASSHDSRASQLHTVALVNMSARLIENLNFLRHYRHSWVLRFHVRPEFVGLLNEGIFAVDDSGKILAANRSAAAQLVRNSGRDLVGLRIDEVFDLAPSQMHERSRYPCQSVWPMRDIQRGQRYFAMLRAPARPRPAAAPAAAADSATTPSLGLIGSASKPTLASLAGSDPRMRFAVRCAERVIDKDVAILLQGETGTGKEVLAQAIHRASSRAERPFVAVNCASIPESLIESELFGYKAGAFTGARREGMRGRIVQASGGTLFLDEIGDMPPELQTRLLRVLEEREVLPLGSESAISVDLRVISATHHDLAALVEQGRFRQDLYYRLNGLTLHLPPLRERNDKDLLIRMALVAESEPGSVPRIAHDAFERLMRYPWPGNIRQLRNCLRTALALCDDCVVRLADLPAEIAHPSPAGVLVPTSSPAAEAPAGTLDSAKRSTEYAALTEHLASQRWHITNTALALGISRNTLYRKMRKYGIRPPAP